MTFRFIKLLAAGFVPLCILAVVSPNLASGFFLFFNLICVCALFADIYITPDGRMFEVIRENRDTLYFKTKCEIQFRVINNSFTPMTVELKDEIPGLHFTVLSSNMKKKLPPDGEEVFSYTVMPTKRGVYRFNAIYLRFDGILGLCRKYRKIECPFEYKVYPGLEDISKYRLITQSHRLLAKGVRQVHRRGQGTEYESMREYVEGDDYRRINWLSTARGGKLIVNQYEAEKNQPIYMMMDTGRPMSYSIKGYKKLDYAINAGIVLSDIVNQKGDNSGLMVFNTSVTKIIPPGKGDSHRKEIMDALYRAEGTTFSSNYYGAFMELVNRQKRRGIVFIFTDFETEEDAKELMAAIPFLSQRHVPVVITMVNESLERIAQGGGSSLKENFHRAMAEKLILDRKKLMRTLNKKGVMCVESPAEDVAINAINRYLSLKERYY